MTATTVSRSWRSRSLAAPLACGGCLAAGAAYVAADDPATGGVFLPCPFRSLTGLWCPGCGMTRATHHLFRGDIAQALRFNLFVVAVLAAIAAAWAIWLAQASGRSIDWVRRIPVRAQVLAGAILVGFAVVRNLPGVDGLRG